MSVSYKVSSKMAPKARGYVFFIGNPMCFRFVRYAFFSFEGGAHSRMLYLGIRQVNTELTLNDIVTKPNLAQACEVGIPTWLEDLKEFDAGSRWCVHVCVCMSRALFLSFSLSLSLSPSLYQHVHFYIMMYTCMQYIYSIRTLRPSL